MCFFFSSGGGRLFLKVSFFGHGFWIVFGWFFGLIFEIPVVFLLVSWDFWIFDGQFFLKETKVL